MRGRKWQPMPETQLQAGTSGAASSSGTVKIVDVEQRFGDAASAGDVEWARWHDSVDNERYECAESDNDTGEAAQQSNDGGWEASGLPPPPPPGLFW